MITQEDLAKIEKEILNIEIPSEQQPFGWNVPSLNIIDCVLSLGRKYEGFTKPRVAMFKDNNPQCLRIEDLNELMESYDSDDDFGKNELNYKHADRMRVIRQLSEYLLLEIPATETLSDQIQECHKWAVDTRPGDSFFLGIRGFGLAGFQYLRMLFGAQTSKPDTHIIGFVQDTIGRKVTAVQALYVMEKVSKKLALPLRSIDHEIWLSRSKKT